MYECVLRARYESLTAICKVNVAEKQHLFKPIPHLPFPFLWLNSFISPLDTTSPQHNVVKCDAHQIIKEARDRSICNAGVELQRSWRSTAQKWRPVCVFGFSFVIHAAVKRVSELKDPSITRAERLEQDLDCVRYIRLFLRASVILIHGTAK